MNTIPRRAALISPEEIARVFPEIPLRVVKVAIKTGELPSKAEGVNMVDLIAWRQRLTSGLP